MFAQSCELDTENDSQGLASMPVMLRFSRTATSQLLSEPLSSECGVNLWESRQERPACCWFYQDYGGFLSYIETTLPARIPAHGRYGQIKWSAGWLSVRGWLEATGLCIKLLAPKLSNCASAKGKKDHSSSRQPKLAGNLVFPSNHLESTLTDSSAPDNTPGNSCKSRNAGQTVWYLFHHFARLWEAVLDICFLVRTVNTRQPLAVKRDAVLNKKWRDLKHVTRTRSSAQGSSQYQGWFSCMKSVGWCYAVSCRF